MRLIFAGPSVYGLALDLGDIVLRPPAKQGDILAATREGAVAIGLIDGQFEQVASVWHKELLYALSEGVRVLGAASMGALRAAECAAFGMEPVGVIAARYTFGGLEDDAAVAITNGPADLAFAPLSEPLVDAEATIEQLHKIGCVDLSESRKLRASAQRIFFKDRTDISIVSGATLAERAPAILKAYREHHVSLKQRDALALISRLKELPHTRAETPPAWSLRQSPMWKAAAR